jgi:hypothetical protein
MLARSSRRAPRLEQLRRRFDPDRVIASGSWEGAARAAEIDAAYAAYEERPLDEPDEWGDLASFRDAAVPRLRRALVGPCTTTIRGLPSEVIMEPGEDPVPHRSAVNLDSLRRSLPPGARHGHATFHQVPVTVTEP